MFNPETTAVLRTVLNEVCESISLYETSARAHVAEKLLEAAARGELSVGELKDAGRKALSQAPTMWR